MAFANPEANFTAEKSPRLSKQMSRMNFNNGVSQQDFSSNQGFLATINDDWLNNMNDIDIFGTDVMNFNARYAVENSTSTVPLRPEIFLPGSDNPNSGSATLSRVSQLDGPHNSNNNTSDTVRDHSVVICPFNDYRYTADPPLPTNEAASGADERHLNQQTQYHEETGNQEQSVMSSGTQAEIQCTVKFPEFDTYPADVLMITQQRDRHSPYADYVSRYTSTEMARRCREKTRMFPRFTCKYEHDPTEEYDDTTDDVVSNWLSWKERVFNSLINLRNVEDKPSSSGYKHFAEKFYATKMMEARCSEVVELCVDLHVNGTKVDDWHNLALQTPSDLELKCRERLERICQFLEREKMACENIMAGTDAIRRMVLAPIAAWKRKMQNRRGNTHKSLELQFAKTVRSSQGQDTAENTDFLEASKGRKRAQSSVTTEHFDTAATSTPLTAQESTGIDQDSKSFRHEEQELSKRQRTLPARESIFTQGESSTSAARRAPATPSMSEPLPSNLTAAEIFATGPFAARSSRARPSSSSSTSIAAFNAAKPPPPSSSPERPSAASPHWKGTS